MPQTESKRINGRRMSMNNTWYLHNFTACSIKLITTVVDILVWYRRYFLIITRLGYKIFEFLDLKIIYTFFLFWPIFFFERVCKYWTLRIKKRNYFSHGDAQRGSRRPERPFCVLHWRLYVCRCRLVCVCDETRTEGPSVNVQMGWTKKKKTE